MSTRDGCKLKSRLTAAEEATGDKIRGWGQEYYCWDTIAEGNKCFMAVSYNVELVERDVNKAKGEPMPSRDFEAFTDRTLCNFSRIYVSSYDTVFMLSHYGLRFALDNGGIF